MAVHCVPILPKSRKHATTAELLAVLWAFVMEHHEPLHLLHLLRQMVDLHVRHKPSWRSLVLTASRRMNQLEIVMVPCVPHITLLPI